MLGWAVAGWVVRVPGDRYSLPALCVVALNAAAGVLLLVRRPALATAAPALLLGALPSFLSAGALWALAPSPGTWPPLASLVFGVGAAGTLAAFCWLGRSFAVLPARRALTTTGPYGVVRHPAYVGELLMVLGSAGAALHATSGWRLVAALLLAAATPLSVALRVMVEERVLGVDPIYGAYQRRVRWRLLPWVW